MPRKRYYSSSVSECSDKTRRRNSSNCIQQDVLVNCPGQGLLCQLTGCNKSVCNSFCTSVYSGAICAASISLLFNLLGIGLRVGPSGSRGQRGFQGIEGTQGLMGATGAQGFQGPI